MLISTDGNYTLTLSGAKRVAWGLEKWGAANDRLWKVWSYENTENNFVFSQ